MKKTYVTPAVETMTLSTVSVLAASPLVSVDDSKTVGGAGDESDGGVGMLGREKVW